MITGIGTDITNILRVERVFNRYPRIIDKVLTENEKVIFHDRKNKITYLTSRFSSKESIAKALGTGFQGFSFRDIEVLNNDLGKPYVILSKKILEKFRLNDNYKIHLSISHSDENVVTYVIIEFNNL